MIGRIPKLALAGIALVLGAALAAGAFAAFGAGSSTTTTAASGIFDPAAQRQTLQRFQQCMSDQGVQLPQQGRPPPPGGRWRNGPRGPRTPSPKARRAFQACGRYLPQRPPGPPPGGVPPAGLPPRPFQP